MPSPSEAALSELLPVPLPLVVAIGVGVATLAGALWHRRKPPSDGAAAAATASSSAEEADVPPGPVPDGFPEDGVFTLQSLAHFDGRKLPLCLGVCGKVVDCSGSDNIKYGEGYGKLWAGADATYSLATLSLKPEDAGKQDYTLEDFNEEQIKALAGWYKHFTGKYKVVGTLKEYEGRDFSSVEALSKDMTPFNMGAGTEEEDKVSDAGGEEAKGASVAATQQAAAPAAAAAAPAAAPASTLPEGAVTFKAGDAVVIQGLKSRPDLNGKTAVLKLYNAEKKRFGVVLDDSNEQMLLQPSNLQKA